MLGFGGLQVHPDVPDGISALHDLGCRLVTLSNGSASAAEGLFARAGSGIASNASCRWTTPASGNPHQARTTTRSGNAGSNRWTRCWWRPILEVSTAHHAPASAQPGPTGRARSTRNTARVLILGRGSLADLADQLRGLDLLPA